jgi:hypothetical protein
MKFHILALIAAVVSSPFPQEQIPESPEYSGEISGYEVCSTSSAVFTLEAGTFTPNPIIKGKDVTVHLIGQLAETIEVGATAKVLVKYGYSWLT